MEQRSFSDVRPDVVASLLKNNNLILVRNNGISEWNRVVYVVTEDAQPTASGGSTVLFKPKYTAPTGLQRALSWLTSRLLVRALRVIYQDMEMILI
jgi:hypothetical protein